MTRGHSCLHTRQGCLGQGISPASPSIPFTITSYRGAQFKSDLWHQLMHLLGSTRMCTMEHHPEASKMVECFHYYISSRLVFVPPIGKGSPHGLPWHQCQGRHEQSQCMAPPHSRVIFHQVENVPDSPFYVCHLCTIMQLVQYTPPHHLPNTRPVSGRSVQMYSCLCT